MAGGEADVPRWGEAAPEAGAGLVPQGLQLFQRCLSHRLGDGLTVLTGQIGQQAGDAS
jgi:hypothetical protein